MKAWILNSRIVIEKYCVCNLPVTYNNYYNIKDTMIRNKKLHRFLKLLPLSIFLMVFAFNAWAVESGKINIPAEIKNLKEKNVNKKLGAIQKLSKSKNKKAIKALTKQFKSEKNQYMRARIAEAFMGTKEKAMIAEMVNALQNDPSSDVRYSAVRVLAYANDKTVVPLLISTFLDEKEAIGVRLQAAASLTKYGHSKEIYECFETGLKNAKPKIRMQAIVSISRSFGRDKKKMEPLLKKMLKDKDEKVRKIAERRLEILKGKIFPEQESLPSPSLRKGKRN